MPVSLDIISINSQNLKKGFKVESYPWYVLPILHLC